MTRWTATVRLLGFVLAFAATAGPLAAQEVIELPAEDRLLEADFEEVYRVGSVVGGGWDTFGQIGDVAFDGAGNLYIFDMQALRITVVDRTGTLVRRIGGRGEGPGEFQSDVGGLLHMVVMPDGRAVVYTWSRGAFVVFRTDGEFERTFRIAGGAMTSFMGMQVLPGTNGVLATSPVLRPTNETGTRRSSRAVERFLLDGYRAVIDTVAEAWNPSGRTIGVRPAARERCAARRGRRLHGFIRLRDQDRGAYRRPDSGAEKAALPQPRDREGQVPVHTVAGGA